MELTRYDLLAAENVLLRGDAFYSSKQRHEAGYGRGFSEIFDNRDNGWTTVFFVYEADDPFDSDYVYGTFVCGDLTRFRRILVSDLSKLGFLWFYGNLYHDEPFMVSNKVEIVSVDWAVQRSEFAKMRAALANSMWLSKDDRDVLDQWIREANRKLHGRCRHVRFDKLP